MEIRSDNCAVRSVCGREMDAQMGMGREMKVEGGRRRLTSPSF